jgi:hypothetical protein
VTGLGGPCSVGEVDDEEDDDDINVDDDAAAAKAAAAVGDIGLVGDEDAASIEFEGDVEDDVGANAIGLVATG